MFWAQAQNNNRVKKIMPRPKKCRLIENLPQVNYFKPRGVPMAMLEEIVLPVEGFEALRLVDIEGLSQEEASERMNVSRQTFGRTLASARRILAETVVLGRALRIDGGDYILRGRSSEIIAKRRENSLETE